MKKEIEEMVSDKRFTNRLYALIDNMEALGQDIRDHKNLLTSLASVCNTSDDMVLMDALDYVCGAAAGANSHDSRGMFIKELAAMICAAKLNFPDVQLTIGQAQALALTNMSKEVLDTLIPPWRAFTVTFPEAFATGGYSPRYTLVHVIKSEEAEFDDNWGVFTEVGRLGSARAAVHTFNTTPSLLAGKHEICGGDLLKDFSTDDSKAERMEHLIIRCVLQVCAIITNKTADIELKTTTVKKKKGKKFKLITKPMVNTFILGVPVIVGSQNRVDDFLSSSSDRVLGVEFERAAHHYWQAYGPKHSLRRWVPRSGCTVNKDKGLPKLIRPHKISKDLVPDQPPEQTTE
jgi:hypothetical protein